MISYKWESLANLQKDWVHFICAEGFDHVKKEISAIYQSRWQILAKFAKMTTKRLQEVRKIVPSKATAKKASITRDDVIALLGKRGDPIEEFIREILSLIPEADIKKSVRKLKLGEPRTNGDAILIIRCEAIRIYAHYDTLTIRKDVLDKFQLVDRKWDQTLNALKSYYEIQELVSRANQALASDYMRMPWKKWVGRLTYLISTRNALSDKITHLNDHYDPDFGNITDVIEIPVEVLNHMEATPAVIDQKLLDVRKIFDIRQRFDDTADPQTSEEIRLLLDE
jgi:hypothetical protein